jgi:hypothetical protein
VGIVRTTLCSLLSVCLSTGAVMLPTTAAASTTASVAVVTAVQRTAPASVLGLEAEDAAAGKALTQALRKAFAARGMSGGEELSFSEVKLTMGCENDDPKCLAQAGESLGISRMIYGYLRKSGGGNFKVQVFVLDVGAGMVEKETTVPVSAADLSSDRIDQTATEIVNSLYPDEDDGETPTVIPGDETEVGETEPVVRDKPPRESDYVWGRYKPRPKWKWAGLGVGIGLLTAGVIVGAIGAFKIRQPGGPLEKELYKQADESLNDTYADEFGPTHPRADELNPENDIDRAEGGNLCAMAESAPAGMPNRVVNSDVATVCRDIRVWTGLTNASWAAVVIGGVMTVAFTTLLFVHKAKPKANARRRGGKHQVRVDAGPMRGGGVLVGGSGRF